MAFNGSGVFVRLFNWVNDAANGINITASRMDSETDGIASGLSNCITRDGQGKPTGPIDWNAQNLSNVANLSTTGNTVLGDAATDTFNLAAGTVQGTGAGNVGFGSAPPAWAVPTSNVITVGPAGGGAFEGQSSGMRITANTFFDGTNWRRINAAEPTIYLQIGGAHIWYNNVTGTANSTYTPTEIGRWTNTGQFYGMALHNNASPLTGTTNQYVGSGTYTPTLFNTANVASSTAFVCQWTRVGNVVNVSGRVTIDPTSTGTNTNLGMSIPIASTFVGVENLGGTAICGSAPASGLPGIQIQADLVNLRALFVYQTLTDTNANAFSFSFQYVVL